MQRNLINPRADWMERVEKLGFNYHSHEQLPYWREDAYWQFDTAQIDKLEATAEELHQRAMEAVEYVVRKNLLGRFGIVGLGADLVRRSWENAHDSLYGRMDIAWDGTGEPKLLEYNADTPTSLFEASVVQWWWMQDMIPGADQFNSLHESLVDRFKRLRGDANGDVIGNRFHFASVTPHAEDEATVGYLAAIAVEAGFAAKTMSLSQIGLNISRDGKKKFIDMENVEIEKLFKLYPWEQILTDEYVASILDSRTEFFEPAWKMILSNKAILEILWEMFPDHPNLLPASSKLSTIQDICPNGYVRKPWIGREGANVEIYDGKGTKIAQSDGQWAGFPSVFQAKADLARTPDGGTAVLGVWLAGDKACGMGIREDVGLITRNTSSFVPHIFR